MCSVGPVLLHVGTGIGHCAGSWEGAAFCVGPIAVTGTI